MIAYFARRARDESGVAMIVGVLLSSVILTLAVMSLTVAEHADKGSARGRHWVQSLHVAESGAEKAISKIQETGGAFTGTLTGTIEEGNYSVTVTRTNKRVYTINAIGSVRQGRQLGATRSIRVTMAPPPSFKYALFSYTSLATKNNDIIDGDIWANQNLFLDAHTHILGSAIAATGYFETAQDVTVDGDVTSGGFKTPDGPAVLLGGGTHVGGNVSAAVSDPGDPIDCGNPVGDPYEIRGTGGATIAGWAKTWGSVTGVAPGQGATQGVCIFAPTPLPMPTFTYAATNYDTATLHEFPTQPAGSSTPTTSATAVQDFQTYVDSQPNKELSGTFYIQQTSPNQDGRIDLTGVVFVGDTTIYTNAPIFANGATDNTVDKVVVLASSYKPPAGSTCDVNSDNSDCAVHLKNNFATTPYTATLVYAPYGPVAIKNNALHNGAVYSDAIEIKNNQELTYDERIERVIGFGNVTLEVTRWLELKT